MLALGAMALSSPDVAFFSPPPRRPPRPQRKGRVAGEIARTVLHAIRRDLHLDHTPRKEAGR